MPGWQGSNRKYELPANWRELRAKVATRAGWRCQNYVEGSRCERQGSHCDHIRRGNDHSLDNLQWLCPPCHNSKSSREGAQARPSVNRPREAHPGLRSVPAAPAPAPVSAAGPLFRAPT